MGVGDSVWLQEFEEKQLTDRMHQHEGFELCFILKGEGKWQVGSRTGRFGSGTVVVSGPGTLHFWRSEIGQGCSGIVLRFGRRSLPRGLLALPEMEAVRGLFEGFEEVVSFATSDRERLRSRLRTIDRAKGALRLARFYVALELVATLAKTQVSRLEGVKADLGPRDAVRFETVKRFIEQRFGDAIGRANAAAEAGLDEAVFSRFFKRVAGVTFVDYLASVRVRNAAQLLGSRRDLSVPEVARQSGFRNLSAFHRQFKRKLGTTPDSYRKAANAEMLAP